MILVRIMMHARPEKHKEVFQTLQSMLRKSASEENGLCFDVVCDIDNYHVFSLIMEWETRKDLNRYLLTDDFSAILGIRSLLRESISIRIMTVSAVEGMEAVHFLRNKLNH